MPEDMTVCRYCGHANDSARAACEACNMPLTAYAGELRDFDVAAAKARQQTVEKMKARPAAAVAIAVFDGLFALAWPIATVVGGFAQRANVNSELTNYLGSALGMVGPILKAIVLLPVAVGLGILAWGALVQRSWAWPFNIGALCLFAAMGPFTLLIRLVIAIVLAVLWFMPETKAWYGK